MDKPGVRQVPEGSEEQGKMEEISCEIICGYPMILAVKGQVKVKDFSPLYYQQATGCSVQRAEVGRQRQGMDKPGVRQVPEGQWRTETNGGNWF